MKTIIIADDDKIFRETIARQLRRLGFKAVTNETGDKVLAQIVEHQPVACIIDMVMPGKEGMETIFEISNLEARPVIIGVSGTPSYLNVVRDIVADEVLLKPLEPKTLQAALEKLGIVP